MKPRFFSSRRSIAFKLTLTVCAFLLAFQTVLALLTYFYFRNEISRIISGQQLAILEMAARHTGQKLASSLEVIKEVSKSVPPPAMNDPEMAQRFLDARAGTHALFDNGLFFFSMEGKLLAESPFLPGRRGRNLAFREFFKKSVATGKPLISEPYRSTHTSGAPAVMFTSPLFDRNGRMIGILGGSMNLLHDNFLGILSRTTFGGKGYLFIVNREGMIIVHPDRSRILGYLDSKNPIAGKISEGFEGVMEYQNPAGIRYITTLKAISGTGWVMAANYPEDEAFAPLKKIRQYFLAIFIVGALLTFATVQLTMKRFTAALVRFSEHVRNLVGKRGGEKLFNYDKENEVGIIARRFNEMIIAEEKQKEELIRASTHDSLTGLYNRAYFDSELKRLARGRQAPISVVVADIDNLKICNDTKGHAAGDALIRAAARMLSDSFRVEDIVARIGGDEFAVIIPGMGRDDVVKIIERVKATIALMRHDPGECTLSISLGSDSCDDPADIYHAFRRADEEMYLNKAKNKVI